MDEATKLRIVRAQTRVASFVLPLIVVFLIFWVVSFRDIYAVPALVASALAMIHTWVAPRADRRYARLAETGSSENAPKVLPSAKLDVTCAVAVTFFALVLAHSWWLDRERYMLWSVGVSVLACISAWSRVVVHRRH